MTKDRSSEISALCRKDEKAAFRLLFDSYYTSLVLFANRIINDDVAAEDVVQDSLVSLWQSRNFRNISDGMDRYLFRTVKNKALDYLKSESRSVSLSMPIHEKMPGNPALAGDDIEQYAELYRAIEMLPADRRRIFKLVYFEGYKYQEAAGKLGISINTVQTQLRRSLQFLREKMNCGDTIGNPSAKKLNDITFSFFFGL